MEALEEWQEGEDRPQSSAAFQREYSILRGTLNRIRFLKNKQKIAHHNIVKQVAVLSQPADNENSPLPKPQTPNPPPVNDLSVLGKDWKKVSLLKAYNQKTVTRPTQRNDRSYDDSKQEGSTLCPSLVRGGKVSRTTPKLSLKNLFEEKSANVRRMKEHKRRLQTRIEQRRSADMIRVRQSHSRVERERQQGRVKIEENYIQHIEQIRKDKASRVERRRARQREQISKLQEQCAQQHAELQEWERSILAEEALKIKLQSRIQPPR